MEDYTVSTLTNWGMAEVKQDYKTLCPKEVFSFIENLLVIVKALEDRCFTSSSSGEFPDGFRSM